MRTWISAFFYGLIVFSTFTFTIFTIDGKYFFEAAIFCSAVYYFFVRDKFGELVFLALWKNKILILICTVFLSVFFILGIIRYGNVADPYTDFRSNLFFIVGFVLARNILIKDPEKIYIAATATAILCIVHWVFLYKSDLLESKFPSPFFAAVVALLLSIDSKSRLKILLSLILLSFLSVVSFFRQYWIIAVIMLFLSFIRISTKGRDFFKIALPMLLIGGFVFFVAVDVVDNFFNSSESLYIQSIGKTNDVFSLLDGGEASESDGLRMAYFVYMFENFFYLIAPHGLGYKSNPVNFDPWFYSISDASNTLDSVFLFITYHYGYIVLLPLAFWFFRQFYLKNIGQNKIYLSLLFLVFLIPCLFDGGQLSVLNRAVWFGVFCAYMLKKKNFN